MGLQRFSSRRQRLDTTFLAPKLQGAKSYRRIAGYFRSSILELVGEEIGDIPVVCIVCNSELDLRDIQAAKAAREAALKEKWNETPIQAEAIFHQDRYQRLYELLRSGRLKIKVVPKDKVFLHGKAGVIELADGTKTSFLGSVNESRSAFATNYEILWEDNSAEAVAWVEEEFEALWKDGHDLPDAIIEEVGRIASRVEVRFPELKDREIPGAVMVESPLYRQGEQLQPWQRAFVSTFLDHRERYGKARLLIADEVGLGKTLSMATSALVSALLNDGKVLILCPSTLTLQWQVELKDRLGIPSAVWVSNKKHWLDPDGHVIPTRGPEDVIRCPYQIAIVSTGLIIQPTREREVLLTAKYGTLVLDEAHKARRKGGFGDGAKSPNNLLEFMLKVALRCRHLILGTATPIQTDVAELWDLLSILNEGADFVLGGYASPWKNADQALHLVTGKRGPSDARETWELLRSPLVCSDGFDNGRFDMLRNALSLARGEFFSSLPYGDLSPIEQYRVDELIGDCDFFRRNNPIARHTVLRRRRDLEDKGLLERVAVDIHPNPNGQNHAYAGIAFIDGLGLLTNAPFQNAYEAAERFTELLQKRTKAAGFMKTLLLQRICSSFASGRSTAQAMLDKRLLEEEENAHLVLEELSKLTPAEAEQLAAITFELSRPEATDPKLDAVLTFLSEVKSAGKTWREHGCIVFSQYYDTADWVASKIAQRFPEEVVAVYAGVGKSKLYRAERAVAVEREAIKQSVKKRDIRLVVATDAACEGLNLQTLGTLINVDLPWNPSRLEQRLGRIKRFGQARKSVDMLNLVYHETMDEKVYQKLSERMRDKFDIFGGMPDVIDDDWIDDIEKFERQADKYIEMRKQQKDVFAERYGSDFDVNRERWELCTKVLSRSDIDHVLERPW